MRITQKTLESRVEAYNVTLGFTGKLWNRVGKRNVATVGMYTVDAAYGGYKVALISNDGGGQSDITRGFDTARNTIAAFNEFLADLSLANGCQH